MTLKTLKIPLIEGLIWTILMLCVFIKSEAKLSVNLVFFALSVATGGLIFGGNVLFKYLSNRLYKLTIIELDHDEKLITEGKANHFKGVRVAGGRLVLTDKRLIFKSLRNYSKAYQECQVISEIKNAYTFRTWYLFKNGLRLELADSKILKFIVEQPEKWVEVILELKTANSPFQTGT